MIPALLRTWGRVHVRVPGFASAGALTAVCVAWASAWAAWRLVERVRPEDVVGPAELYVGLGFAPLSVFVLQDVVRFLLSERRDAHLVRLAPRPRCAAVGARLLFNVLLHLPAFALALLPPLVVLGAAVGAPPSYYAVLIPTSLAVVTGACALGTMGALPLAWLLRRWPGLVARSTPPELHMALELGSVVIRPQALLIAALVASFLEAQGYGVRVLWAAFWTSPLRAALRVSPVGLSLAATSGLAAGLVGLALLVYRLGEGLTLEPRFRRRKGVPLSPVRFARLPVLVRAPLRTSWLFDSLLILAAVGLAGFFSVHFPPALVAMFLAAGLALGTGSGADWQVFTRPYLFKMSPASPLKVLGLLGAGNVLKALLAAGLGAGGFALLLAARGDPTWAVPLLMYPVQGPTLIAPLVLADTGLRVWKALGSLYVTDFHLGGTVLALAVTLSASRYLLFPNPFAPFAQPWRLLGLTVGLALLFAAGIGILFRLAGRSLEGLEWA